MKKGIEHWWHIIFSPEGATSGEEIPVPGTKEPHAYFVQISPFDRHRAIAFLLPLLQSKGFQLTPDRHIRLQKLIDLLPQEIPAKELADYLCPIFATDLQEQAQFHEAFSQLTFLFVRAEKELPRSETKQPEASTQDKDLEEPSKPVSSTPEKTPEKQESELPKPNSSDTGSPQYPLVPDIEKCTDPPFVWKIAPDDHIPLEAKAGFGRTMTRLRSRELSQIRQIDWQQTIRDTARQAGMLSIRKQQRSRPVEYLMLVERFSEEDHRALMFDRLWQMLRDQDVLVDRFFHDGDLRNCFNEQFPLGISLRDLRYRFGNARLLVLGTGHRMLNPLTGRPAEWTAMLPDWRQRALLTPISRQEWGIQEKNITALLPLLPAAWESVEYLSELTGGEEKKHYAELPNYVKDAADWKPIELGKPLMYSLRQHFDEKMCAWIAACALWPSLHFDLTLRMGRLFSTPESNLLTLDKFTKLCRLEWFANGFIPRPERSELLEYLEARFPDQLQLAIEVLLSLLEENLTEIPHNSRARAEHQINLAILRLMSTESPNPEVIQQLRTVIKRLDRNAEITDFVLPASVETMLEKLGLAEKPSIKPDNHLVSNLIPYNSIYRCGRKEQLFEFQKIYSSTKDNCLMFGLLGGELQGHWRFIEFVVGTIKPAKNFTTGFSILGPYAPSLWVSMIKKQLQLVFDGKNSTELNRSFFDIIYGSTKSKELTKDDLICLNLIIDEDTWEKPFFQTFIKQFYDELTAQEVPKDAPRAIIFWSFEWQDKNFYHEVIDSLQSEPWVNMLPELKMVTLEQIQQWFQEYMPGKFETYRHRFPHAQYDVGEVEQILGVIINEYNKSLHKPIAVLEGVEQSFDVNSIFSDRYVLEQLLAKGGMSEVWKAVDTETGSFVSLKIYNPLNGIAEKLVKHEFELTQQFASNKYLNTALDLGQESGRHYLVFPYFKETASGSIGRIEEDEVWNIVHDIGSALDFMHISERLVLHNDIKPAHFLKSSSGDYVLSDFSISEERDQDAELRVWNDPRIKNWFRGMTVLANTLPPEFHRGINLEASTPQTDIWSFGLSLFQLITGEIPLEPSVLHEFAKLQEKVSPELADLIIRCLSLKPERRPSAKEILRKAREWRVRTSISVPPLKTFIIYARADARFKDELLTHLRPFVKNGLLEKWVDSDLLPGEEWEKRIEKELEAAQLVIMLVSADAINSDFIEKKELKIALEKKRAGSARVAPILVRDCLWEMHDELAEIQLLPKDESGNIRSISSWNSSDSAWASSMRDIKKLVDEIRGAIKEEAQANSEAIKKQVQIESEKNEHKRSRIDEAVWKNVLKALDQAADSKEKIELLETYLHDETHQNHRAEATALLETIYSEIEQKVDAIRQKATKQKKEQEEATLLKRYEEVLKRKKGIVNTIKSLERRIRHDEEELNFQQKKVSTSEGQLELQIRRAKIKMLEERISNYADQLEKMKRSLAKLDELIKATGHPKEKVDKEEGPIKKTSKPSRSNSKEDKVEGGRPVSEVGSKLQRSEIAKELPDIQDKKGQPEMVFVQGGTFKMGGEFEATLSDYEIGKYPVTQQLWQDIMKNNPSHFKGDNLPVERVSWNDCQEFLKKLNAKFPGKNYRLPTEAEWEFAARGGIYSNGYEYAGSDKLEQVGWFWENSGETVLSGEWNINKIQKFNCRTHSVGRKISNELGIYDMSGNVWEWCQDWHRDYPKTPQNNPKGANSGVSRIFRGGSWDSVFSNCFIDYRYYTHPGNRSFNLGFRLARTIEIIPSKIKKGSEEDEDFSDTISFHSRRISLPELSPE